MALLALISAPLAAQSQADPVRLDDYAVATTRSDTSHVDQLAPAGDRLEEPSQPQDRTIAAPQSPGGSATALVQVSVKGESSEQAQLSKSGARPDGAQAAVSSTGDSRPQAAVRIGGQDSCDPQLAGEALERCKRILELRAQEFSAPTRPRLSAEQQLLAEQRSDKDLQSGPTPETRLRLASRVEPDADLQSNQEVAALYFRGQQQAPPTVAEPEDAEAAAADGALAQILNALQGQAGGSAPPP